LTRTDTPSHFIVKNSLGSLLALNAGSVVDFEIWTGGALDLRETPPIQPVRDNALQTKKTTDGLTELSLPSLDGDPRDEIQTLQTIATELKLDKLDDWEKIETLKAYFLRDFTYTTHLTISDSQKRSPLVNFLTSTKSGHCEYYATATTLLLRAAGIPTRYVVGYAVREKGESPEEYLLRGTHAHAWCRAYLGGRKEIVPEERIITRAGKEVTILLNRVTWTGGEWVDVDLTPPDWAAVDSPSPNFQERLSDTLQRFREDFQIWRSSESNRGWVNVTLGIMAIAVVGFIAWRLNGSRIRNEKTLAVSQSLVTGPETALSLVLPELEEGFGKRPQGLLLGDWLRGELANCSQEELRTFEAS